MSLVSFVKIDKINPIKQAINDSLSLIDYSFPRKTKKVVIKPNLCYYWDNTTGQTTDPTFVATLIDMIKEEISPDVSISVVESDASAMKCKYTFRMLGYEKMAKNCNVELVNLSEDKNNTKEVTAGNQSFELMIPQTIHEADLLINIPKIKYTMDPIKLTCALKNIFGCNPYPTKFKYHPILGEAIVAINKAMKFDLCIIDSDIVSGIQPRRLGLVMAGKDPVAVDAAAAEIAGLNPKTIEYLQLAEKEGLGTTSFIPRGTSISHFKAGYPKKTMGKKLMGLGYKMVIRVGLGKRLGLG